MPQDPTKFLDGIVVKRRPGAKPNWSDVLFGDEVGNAGTVDISKLQQLLLSLVAVVAYAYAIGRTMSAAGQGIVQAVVSHRSCAIRWETIRAEWAAADNNSGRARSQSRSSPSVSMEETRAVPPNRYKRFADWVVEQL